MSLVIGSVCSLTAQHSYTQMTREALGMMWQAKGDSSALATSLQLFEKAFAKYPDSLDFLGLYKASVLAGELVQKDKAFAYLAALRELNDPANPAWRLITGEYVASEFKNLIDDPRWAVLLDSARAEKAAFYQKLQTLEAEFFATKNNEPDWKLDAKELYQKLKNHNSYTTKKHRNYSLSFPINDSIKTSYYVHLPQDYSPNQKFPLLIVLHGAVRSNALADYQNEDVLAGWNRFYTEYADRYGVILLFPKGSRAYNWMVPDDGLFMVPAMLRQLKKAINVDDNRVFISGHSNGATGSFSYLMKQPTPFAGFYGFNTYPKVFTGGTFVENINNRSFKNFSTDLDYYYPPQANDHLSRLMATFEADYRDHRYTGFPHWFPKFDESKPAFQLLFQDLSIRQRNPFPRAISWELDEEKYGTVDWVADIELDTLLPKAAWHQTANFKIEEWLYYEQDSLRKKTVDQMAFDFPRKSGKITAVYQDNVFRIKTSRIKSFKIYISPEMVDLERPVAIYVNDRLRFREKTGFNRTFLQDSFSNTGDRDQLWVNYIPIEL